MSKRSGFTLMELLLVVAILAIVAAVAAPQFFRTSEKAITDARIALLKANYQAIKNATNMYQWDFLNNTTAAGAAQLADISTLTQGAVNAAATGVLATLVKAGYLQESACYIENRQGARIKLAVFRALVTPEPASTVIASASIPTFMQKSQLFKITLSTTAAGTDNAYDIDVQLQAGKSWPQIWDEIKDLVSL